MNQAIIESKKAVVSEITTNLKESQSTVVVEYRGLTVKEITELRRALGKENVEMKVYKNKLAQRAATEAGFEELCESLTGPNALVFGKDATAPARVLSKFAKDHDKLVMKAGTVEGKVVGLDTLTTISNLPNREGMYSMLLSVLQAPVRNFACVVKAVADKQAEPATAEAE
ncbi:MAG: 50S ribosomal protein L10 [Traorella sp.]